MTSADVWANTVSRAGTFSRFESLSEKSVDDHVEALLGTVEGISGTEG